MNNEELNEKELLTKILNKVIGDQISLIEFADLASKVNRVVESIGDLKKEQREKKTH